jgi:phage shock protein A
MKSKTRNALLKAYAQLQQIIDDLYEASDNALESDDFEDASLLATRADKLYEEAENLEFVISELEDR